MMSEKILILLTGIISLTGCRSGDPEIWALCLRDGIGNYIIKWETDPQLEGTMKFYVSDDPDKFNKSKPAGIVNIHNNITRYITHDNMSRQYFLLTFNDKYPRVVGSRSVMMDNIMNLRDMGGYYNTSDKMSRWGKVYRSGSLSRLSEWDSIRLSNLGIRTIIDLRTEEEVFMEPVRYKNADVIHIPVKMGNIQDILQRIQKNRVRKGDGILFMQDMYLQYITDNSVAFKEALEIFMDRDNYPILFNCSFGKDRAGFMAAMLLAALDVPDETIYMDYMLSNEYMDLSHVQDFARELSSDAQETITAMLMANDKLMELAFRKITREYGSIDKYLSKELNLSEKRRNQLKDILLF